MHPTITMVSLHGREALTEETIRTLNERGGMSGYTLSLFYFSHVEKIQRALALPPNVEFHHWAWLGMMPDFWKILAWIPEGADWLFLEDDISPCVNAVRRMIDVEIPDDIGMLSFFDLRNEWNRPGIWRNKQWEDEGKTKRRHFYGSQAVKMPARTITMLKQFGAEKRPFSANWDTWLGLAIDELGLRQAHYSPSLVQHVGMVSVAYPDGGAHGQDIDNRPLTGHFPGEDFDALGPSPDPVVGGGWSQEVWLTRQNLCPLRRKPHPGGMLCPLCPLPAGTARSFEQTQPGARRG
jgi:hypothetical protein